MTSPTAGYFGSANFSAYSGSSAGGWPSFGSLDNVSNDGNSLNMQLGADTLQINKDGSVNISGPGGQKITEWGDPHVGTGTNNNEETTNETTSFNSNDGHYTVTVVPTQANGSDVSTVNQVFVRDNFTGETKQISGFNGGSGGNSTGGLSMQNSSPYTMPQASAAQTFHWSPALNDLVNSYGQTPAQVQAGPVVTDPFFGQTPPFMSM